jgi:hypothetical protein
VRTISGFEFVQSGNRARVSDEAGNQAVGVVAGSSVQKVMAVGLDLKGIRAARLALRVAVAVSYQSYGKENRHE